MPFKFLVNLVEELLNGGPMGSPIPNDVCIACESKDVTVIEEEVYVCNTCGYEGGAGRAALQKKRRLMALDELGPEQRQRRIKKNFEEARLTAMSVAGTIEASLTFGNSGHDHDYGNQRLITVTKMLMEANERLEESAYMMGIDLPLKLQILKNSAMSGALSGTENKLRITAEVHAIVQTLANDEIRRALQWAKTIESWSEHHLEQINHAAEM